MDVTNIIMKLMVIIMLPCIGVTFSFVPQSAFTVLERDTFDSLEIQKSGATTFTFRVMLRIELIINSGSSSMYEK